MNGFQATPLLPTWLVLPAAGIILLILAGYASSLQSGDVPPKRRRIRTANTLLMMLATPVIAYAFGVVAPSNQRLFLLTWLAITGLVAIMVMLAGMDAMHSVRLHREQRRAVRQALRASLSPTGPDARREPSRNDDPL